MALYCYLETQSSQTPEHQIQQSGRTRASIRPHIMQTVFKIASCWSWWNYKSRIWCSMPVIYDHRSLQAECFQGTSSLLVICIQLILSPKRCFSSGHWADICSSGKAAFIKKWPLFIHHNIKTNINAKCNIKAINLLSSGQVFVILPFTEWQTLPLGCWCLDWASCLFFLNAVSVDYMTMKCPTSCYLGSLLLNSIAEQFSLYCLFGGGGGKAGRFCSYYVILVSPCNLLDRFSFPEESVSLLMY